MHPRFPIGHEEKRTALLAAVEGVRETVTSHADEAEAMATLPPATVDALMASGLLTLKLPTVLGGAEADPVTQVEVIDALSAMEPSEATSPPRPSWPCPPGRPSLWRAGIASVGGGRL